jgi:hypothetical protein
MTNFNHFVYVAQQPNWGVGRLNVDVSRSLTIRGTHPVGLLWTSDELVAQAASYTLQQTQETNIHTIIVIRTRDPSNKAAADLRLRPLSDQGLLNFFKFRL